MNIGVVHTDESYDVPWEFNKNIGRNKLTHVNGVRGVVNESISKKNRKDQQSLTTAENLCTCRISPISCDTNVKNTPPCGVKAKEMKSKNIHTSSEIQPKQTDPNNYIVWKYRGPETDSRPSSDYDLPWGDSTRQAIVEATASSSFEQKISSNDTKNEKNSSIGSQNSADSGVYDEPWDNKNCHRNLAKIIKNKNDLECCSSSPCTSRSASSQGSVSVSSGGGSRETLNNSSAIISHQKTKKFIQTVEASTNTTASTPISKSTLHETAFCSKTNRNSSERESFRLQEVRDRLIQQLCNSTTASAQTPTPAVRRSKLKSLEEISPNDHRRSNDGGGVRRSMDNVRSPPQPTINDDMKKISELKQNDLTTNVVDNCTGENNRFNSSASVEVYDIPWEFGNGAKLERLKNHLNRRSSGGIDGNDETAAADKRAATPKNFNLNRQHLQLNFGCAGLNPASEKVDAALSLDQQPWYHGNVTRAEAEQRLRTCKEGSYLVRVCESAQSQKHEEYALSLKSAKGFMHMKIQLNADKKWILGYFSHPFESISKMIRYYSVNKLPIKGAEHMCLIQPIVDQVL